MGTQTKGLNETVFFEHPKQMLKLMGKKIMAILHSKYFLIEPFICLSIDNISDEINDLTGFKDNLITDAAKQIEKIPS